MPIPDFPPPPAFVSPDRLTLVCSALLAAAMLLGGCSAQARKPDAHPESAAPLPAPAPAAPVSARELPEPPPAVQSALKTDPDTPLSPVLQQIDRIVQMAPPELTREIARLSEIEEAAAENPLLLAVALAQTRQPVDTARALGLVQRVLGNGADAALHLHPLARLMEARLVHARRLEDQLDRHVQLVRDAQRRNDQLSERLEAVRAIERSLSTRPAPSPSAPAAAAGSAVPRPAP